MAIDTEDTGRVGHAGTAVVRRVASSGGGHKVNRQKVKIERSWLIGVPGGVVVVLLVGVPFVAVVYFSFFAVTPNTIGNILSMPLAGVSNYVDALTQPAQVGTTFTGSLIVSLKFSGLTSLVDIPLGVFAAMTVSERGRRQGAWRAIYLVPYVIPGVVTALAGRFFFTTRTGFVDEILKAVGVTNGKTLWLLGGNSFWAMVLLEIWSTWGFVYLLVLAGLQSIDENLMEAAVLDGCGYVGRWRAVVWPAISRLTLFALALSTLFHFNNFTLPFILFDGTPPPQSYVLSTNVYLTSFQGFNTGLGCAEGVLMMVIELVPVVVYLRVAGLTRGRVG